MTTVYIATVDLTLLHLLYEEHQVFTVGVYADPDAAKSAADAYVSWYNSNLRVICDNPQVTPFVLGCTSKPPKLAIT